MIITPTLTVSTINGSAASTVLLPSFVQTDATDVTLWNYGQGGITSNTTYGELALRSNTTGFSNTAIGVGALENNTTGLKNTASGEGALQGNTIGNDNTAIGVSAIQSNTIGSHNTAIGMNTDSGNFDASIILGKDAIATASNQFVSGSVGYPAGAVNAAVVAQTQTWDVIINGVAHKILLA